MPWEQTDDQVPDLEESIDFWKNKAKFRREKRRFEVDGHTVVYLARGPKWAIYISTGKLPMIARTAFLKELHEELTGRGIEIDPPQPGIDGVLEMRMKTPSGKEALIWEDPDYELEGFGHPQLSNYKD